MYPLYLHPRQGPLLFALAPRPPLRSPEFDTSPVAQLCVPHLRHCVILCVSELHAQYVSTHSQRYEVKAPALRQPQSCCSVQFTLQSTSCTVPSGNRASLAFVITDPWQLSPPSVCGGLIRVVQLLHCSEFVTAADPHGVRTVLSHTVRTNLYCARCEPPPSGRPSSPSFPGDRYTRHRAIKSVPLAACRRRLSGSLVASATEPSFLPAARSRQPLSGRGSFPTAGSLVHLRGCLVRSPCRSFCDHASIAVHQSLHEETAVSLGRALLVALCSSIPAENHRSGQPRLLPMPPDSPSQ